MALRKGYRITLYVLGFALLGLCLFWFGMPLWFPWLLKPVAAGLDAGLTRYERVGYGRFAIHGVAFTNENLRLTARRAEAFVPNLWLWRLAKGSADQKYVTIEDWNLEFLSTTNSRATERPSTSTFTNAHGILDLARVLKQWVPRAALSNGTLQFSGIKLLAPTITWSNGVMNGAIQLPDLDQDVSVAADFRKPPHRIDLVSQSLHLTSAIRLVPNAGSGMQIESSSVWRSNRIHLASRFAQSGTLPVQASLIATNLQFSAAMLGIPQYDDVRGRIEGRWEDGQYNMTANGIGRPLDSATNLPPVEFELAVSGDTNSALVHKAILTAPGIQARLTRNAEVFFHGPYVRSPVGLRVQAALDAQPWVTAEGSIVCDVDLEPTGRKYPIARFLLSGTNAGYAGVRANVLEVQGALDYPTLEIGKSKAEFSDGSLLAFSGGGDIRSQTLAPSQIEFNGTMVNRWLPSGYQVDRMRLRADFQGPIRQLSHHGNLELGPLSSPSLHPLTLNADWRGRHDSVEQFQVEASASNAAAQASGSFERSNSVAHLHLKTFTLTESSNTVMNLQAPVRAILVAGEGTNKPVNITLSPLRLTGPEVELQAEAWVTWPAAGSVMVSARGLDSHLLRGFIRQSPPEGRVDFFNASAMWTNGPVTWSMHASGSAGTNLPFRASLDLSGDGTGTRTRRLAASENGIPVLEAEAAAPITFHPSDRERLVQVDKKGPIRLGITADPGPWLLGKLTEFTGVKVEAPLLKASVSGTMTAPVGNLHLNIAQVIYARTNVPPLDVTDLDLTVEATSRAVRIPKAQVFVQHQPVSLTVELPLSEGFWAGLKTNRTPDLHAAKAHLSISNAPVASFAELLPDLIAPEGRLEVDLKLQPGFNLDGVVALSGARTRALPGLGPVREADLRVRFDKRVARFEDTRFRLGGSSVTLRGEADLSGTNWIRSIPPVILAVNGTNVPLVRQPEALIRSDLALTIFKTNAGPPVIGGEVKLKDSYFLADLADLMPSGIAGPKRRPPYFSVEHPLVKDSVLAVRVTGDRFLKARTTVFNGEISADLDLQGTLKEPAALGNIRIDSGVVRFPFGVLEIQQGFVNITSENPYRPQLSVLARSKQFGYDIRMEVSGSADAPIVQFTSTPPLASDQILFLLTAGELPAGDYALSTQQRAQALAMFLGRELLTKLGFGDQAEQRLVIRSGEEISEAGKPTYRVEFKLTEDWSLVAEYDRFGDFNMGARWRFYSK